MSLFSHFWRKCSCPCVYMSPSILHCAWWKRKRKNCFRVIRLNIHTSLHPSHLFRCTVFLASLFSSSCLLWPPLLSAGTLFSHRSFPPPWTSACVTAHRAVAVPLALPAPPFSLLSPFTDPTHLHFLALLHPLLARNMLRIHFTLSASPFLPLAFPCRCTSLSDITAQLPSEPSSSSLPSPLICSSSGLWQHVPVSVWLLCLCSLGPLFSDL